MKLTKDDFKFTEEFFQELEEARIILGVYDEKDPFSILIHNSDQILKNQDDAEKWNKFIAPRNAEETIKPLEIVERLKKRIESNEPITKTILQSPMNLQFILKEELQKILKMS